MKTFSSDALAAITAGQSIGVGAIKIGTGSAAFRAWGGYGDLTIGGEVYKGVGDRTLVNTSGGSLGTASQDTTITLSGVDPDTLAVLDLSPIRNAPAVLYRLTFDGSGRTLLASQVHLRGRCDFCPREDTPGGPSKISLTIKGPAAGLGKNLSRRRTDADQRLISGTDSGMKHVSYAGSITLAWGGKAPAKASVALPNSTAPTGGGGGGGVSGSFDLNTASFQLQ